MSLVICRLEADLCRPLKTRLEHDYCILYDLILHETCTHVYVYIYIKQFFAFRAVRYWILSLLLAESKEPPRCDAKKLWFPIKWPLVNLLAFSFSGPFEMTENPGASGSLGRPGHGPHDGPHERAGRHQGLDQADPRRSPDQRCWWFMVVSGGLWWLTELSWTLESAICVVSTLVKRHGKAWGC